MKLANLPESRGKIDALFHAIVSRRTEAGTESLRYASRKGGGRRGCPVNEGVIIFAGDLSQRGGWTAGGYRTACHA